MTWREPRRILELARVVVAPRDGYPDAGPDFLAANLPDLARSRDLPRFAAPAAVGERAARTRRGRSIAALSRAGCGRGLHRRPWAVPKPLEDRLIVTEPALPADTATAPGADGLPKRTGAKPAARATAARARAPDRRAGRGQEGGRHRPARPGRSDDDGRLLRHLLGRVGATARGHRRAASSAACATSGPKPIGREGTAASHWVLVDFGSVIVHIFTPPEREYYGLEKHWSEARTILSVQ